MTSPDTAALRQVAAGVALAVPGVAGLQPSLAARLAGAASRTWPEAATRDSPPGSGVRVDPGPDGSGWHVEVRCVLSEGHRALDVARNVREQTRSALSAHLASHEVPGAVAVAVTVTRIADPAPRSDVSPAA